MTFIRLDIVSFSLGERKELYFSTDALPIHTAASLRPSVSKWLSKCICCASHTVLYIYVMKSYITAFGVWVSFSASLEIETLISQPTHIVVLILSVQSIYVHGVYRRYFIVSINFPLSVEILAYFWRSAFSDTSLSTVVLFTGADNWLALFHALGLFFQEQSSCHTVWSLCELSLYMNSHQLENFKSKTEVLKKKCIVGSFLETERNSITSVLHFYLFIFFFI